jgi:hypothetical protein
MVLRCSLVPGGSREQGSWQGLYPYKKCQTFLVGFCTYQIALRLIRIIPGAESARPQVIWATKGQGVHKIVHNSKG